MSEYFFDLDPNNVSTQLLLQIIAGLFVVAIVSILGLFFKNKIQNIIKLAILWLTDDKISLNAFYIKKYNVEPTNPFGNEIFQQLINEIKHDKITKSTINPNFILLFSENLGMKIKIQYEKEFDLETIEAETPKISSHNIKISMDANIQGIRQLNRIEDFTILAESVHSIIRNICFTSSGVSQSFAVCDISKIEKNRNDSIQDDTLESEITFSEKTIKIKTRSPQSLRKAVKKYVYAYS